MLVLSRKPGQSIYVGDDILITVLNVCYQQIQLGIEAPDSVCILRDDAKQKTRDLAGHLPPYLLTGNGRKNEL